MVRRLIFSPKLFKFIVEKKAKCLTLRSVTSPPRNCEGVFSRNINFIIPNRYNRCIIKFTFSFWVDRNSVKVWKPLRGSCRCRVRLVNESSDADRLTYAWRYVYELTEGERWWWRVRVSRRYIRVQLYESIGDVKYLYTFSMWEKCRHFSRDSTLLHSYFHWRIYQGERVTTQLLTHHHWRQTHIVRAYFLSVHYIVYFN